VSKKIIKANISVPSIVIKGTENLKLDINLSVTLSSGQCLILTGPSGSGKSLTLGLLSGITSEVDHQTNIVCDNLLFDIENNKNKRTSSRLEFVQHVPQDLTKFFISPVVSDEVELSYEVSGADTIEKAQYRRRIFCDLGINNVTYSQIRTLSAGERVLVSVASAIARKPSFLLLDEPYCFLSKENRIKLSHALIEYRGNGGILIIATHDPSVAENLLSELSPIVHKICSSTENNDKPFQSVLAAQTMSSSDEYYLYQLKSADLRVNMNDRLLFSFDDLSIQRGSCILLEGDNGSGKTMFLKYIAGLFDLWPRDAFFDGRAVDSTPPNYPDDIGFVSDSPMSEAFSGKVEEYLRFVGSNSSIKKELYEKRFNCVLDLLAKLEITRYDFVSDLSYGQQKVLSISRYLNCPKLLLIDELPTTSDQYQLCVIWKILTYFLENGTTMIFTSHTPSFFQGLYDRHLRIEDGWLHKK